MAAPVLYTDSHFPYTTPHTGSLCTCWQELVIWNSLQGWAVKSLVGMGYSYGGKGRTRRNKREHLPSEAYWAVRFQLLSESIDFLSHIWLYVLLHQPLTRALHIMGLLWWSWPHQDAGPHIDLCWPKHSPLFKLIHNRVAKCWFHTLIFNGNYQIVHRARHSGVITNCDMGVTQRQLIVLICLGVEI